jgi:hypothetical protein
MRGSTQNMNDFVRFIDEQLQRTAPAGSFKLGREYISDAVRSCYAFFSFEQYASQFLERSSAMAYWQKTGNDHSKARYVYSRMLDFRDEFFKDFQRFNDQYIRLMSVSEGREEELLRMSDVKEESAERNKESDEKNDKSKADGSVKQKAGGADKESVAKNTRSYKLKEVNALRDQASNNYRIQNFYDASRFMKRARAALAEVADLELLPEARAEAMKSAGPEATKQ